MRKESGSGVGIAAAVAVLLVGFAPVLYFLSLGPAVRLADAGLLNENAAEVFYTPLILLAESSRPAEAAMQAYVELWEPTVPVTVMPANTPLPAPAPPAAPLPPPAQPY